MTAHATRRSNIFNPKSTAPFALSRSKIELFLRCPRCFYLDRRLGVAPPRGFPFNLNEAVDLLLKREFDGYRERQEPHPLVLEHDLSLVPFAHASLDDWRNPFTGVRHHHADSNFTVFGGIDDVWVDDAGVLYVVDYKATSKDGEVGIEAPWQKAYKNQLEVYQWLFRQNGFTVSDTGYFVYTNGDRSAESFGNALQFITKIIPHTGTTEWIDATLVAARETLCAEEVPAAGQWCDFCPYRDAAGKSFRAHVTGS